MLEQFEPKHFEDFNDTCPHHGGEIKKEYDFGQLDASVIVFDKCKCALFCPDEAWFRGYTLYSSYAEAAGRATLHKMSNAVKYA